MASDDPRDAWQLLADLREEFSMEVEVRRDLVVQGLALERAVELTLYDRPAVESGLGIPRRSYKTTTRNVDTMRELAEALLAACEFVEQSNPKWAGMWPNGKVGSS